MQVPRYQFHGEMVYEMRNMEYQIFYLAQGREKRAISITNVRIYLRQKFERYG